MVIIHFKVSKYLTFKLILVILFLFIHRNSSVLSATRPNSKNRNLHPAIKQKIQLFFLDPRKQLGNCLGNTAVQQMRR